MSQSEAPFTPTSGSGQGQSEAHQLLDSFWQREMDEIRSLSQNDFKNQELPLARIKKIMKLDDDVKMISAEAPVLFAKAAEIFITELSLRAWVHTEDNKRRTLQRNDIAMAITKYDQFDFLIDIVPRDELKPPNKREVDPLRAPNMLPDQVQYYFQLAQQHQAALQQHSPTGTGQQVQQQATPQIQIVQSGSIATTQGMTVQTGTPTISVPSVLQLQAVTADAGQQQQAQNQNQTVQVQVQQASQVAEINAGTSQLLQIQQGQLPQTGGIQILQQVINANGEIQHIPIQLSQAQLQLIRMQMQGQNSGQPVIIQQAAQVQSQPQQTVYQLQSVAQPGQAPTPVFLTSAVPSGTTQSLQIQTTSMTQADGQSIDDDQS